VPLLFLCFVLGLITLIPLTAAIVATIAVNVVNIAIDKLLEVADPRKLSVLAHLLCLAC
jgi:hypothetical protein